MESTFRCHPPFKSNKCTKVLQLTVAKPALQHATSRRDQTVGVDARRGTVCHRLRNTAHFRVHGAPLAGISVNCARMVLLLIPSGVMVLLLSLLPGPILPFPYLLVWRLTTGWLELPYSSILALGLVLVISVHVPGRVMARDTVKRYYSW